MRRAYLTRCIRIGPDKPPIPAVIRHGARKEIEGMNPVPGTSEADPTPWRGNATALIYTSEASPNIACVEAMAAAGFRPLAPRLLSGRRAELPAPADIALLAFETADDPMIEAFMNEIVPELDALDIPIVATLSPAQIDLVACGLLPFGAELLCDPETGDIRRALERARERPAHRLHDAASDRLRLLHDDVKRLAATLRDIVAPEPPQRGAMPPPRIDAPAVRALIRRRRLRDRFFESGMFADPAWDILLDLYAAHLEGGEVCVSSLCYAAAVPPTTALRWIGTMSEGGLLERRADERDRRRHFIRLTDRAIAAMNGYFLSRASERSH